MTADLGDLFGFDNPGVLARVRGGDYRASCVNAKPARRSTRTGRQRRTKAEVEALQDAICAVAAENQPSTLRQIFYQLVVRDEIDKTENGYDAVGRELLKLRREHVVPYTWIADNTRWMRKPASYTSLADMLEQSARFYRRDLWDNQDAYVEVWCEKDALAGVLMEETGPYDVPLMVARGFSSETYLYSAAQAIAAAAKPTFVYHFGDHDPSGVAAAGAIERRLPQMLDDLGHCDDFTFELVAVTEQQIEELTLPTRPTKRTGNSHAKGFTGDSVELDAIPPLTLRSIVRDCIEQHIDEAAYDALRVSEAAERETLERFVARMGATS